MDWHVKSQQQYGFSTVITSILCLWIMPLIFFVSSASTFYSLRSRGALTFIKEKIMRLFVPLVFGIIVLIPPQVYLERLTHGQFHGSFIDFFPHYFEGFYGFGGNFAWMGLHLWYLLVLFVFSIILLPLFISLTRGKLLPIQEAFTRVIAKPSVIFMPGLLIGFVCAISDPSGALGQRGFGGWPVLAYLPFLLFGFMIFASNEGEKAIEKNRTASYVIAAVAGTALIILWQRFDPQYGSPLHLPFSILFGLTSWTIVIMFAAIFKGQFNRTDRFLEYANEAILPFYILHQTVLIIVGYFAIRLPLPVPLRCVFTAFVSFSLIMAIYEFLVRRFNILRFLFGMKLKK